MRIVAEVSRVPYDLRRGPLLRPRLIRFPGEHHRLYLAMHHLIFDGVSVDRVVLPRAGRALRRLRRRPAVAAAEPADAVRRLRALGAGVDRRSRGSQRRLRPLAASTSTPPPALALPLDHPRPAEPRAPRRRGAAVDPARERWTRLRELGQASRRHACSRCSPPCWALLLGRYSRRSRRSSSPPRPTCASGPSSSRVVGYCVTPAGAAGRPRRRPLVRRAGRAGAQRAAGRARPPGAVRAGGPRAQPPPTRERQSDLPDDARAGAGDRDARPVLVDAPDGERARRRGRQLQARPRARSSTSGPTATSTAG